VARYLDCLFFGTSQGSVRAYLWPFTNYQLKQQEFVEMALHQGPVTLIRLSPDLNYMMSGSEDGTIYVCSVKEFRDGSEYTATDMMSKDLERNNFSIANLYCFNQLTFVSRANQENKKDQIKELEFRISNLKTDIDDEKERIISRYNAEIKQIEDKNRHDIA
jgi:WD40 repeat protein